MKQKLYTVLVMSFLGIFTLSCMPLNNTDDSTRFDKLHLFKNAWAEELKIQYIEQAIDSDIFSHEIVSKGSTDENEKAYRLDFSMLETGGQNGLAVTFTNTQNLSEYKALSFMARALSEGSELEKIIISNGKDDDKVYVLKHSGNEILDTSKKNVFGLNWRKVTIPIFNGVYLRRTNTAVQFFHSFDEGGGKGAILEIDDLQFEKDVDINSLMDRIEYDDGDLDMWLRTSVSLPKTVRIYLNDMGKGDVVLEDTTESSLTWSSSNNNIVRIEGEQITAIDVGIAIVQGQLKGTSILGPEIGINSISEKTEDHFYIYDDNWSQSIDRDQLIFQEGDSPPHKFEFMELDGKNLNSDGRYLQLDFSMLENGGQNGINAMFLSNQDLSGYNAFSFWVRANTTETKLEKIVLTSENGEIRLKNIDNPNLEIRDYNVFGTKWRKVLIPIFNSMSLSDTNIAVQLLHSYNSEDSEESTDVGGILDIDDLKYEKLDSIQSLVKYIAYNTDEITLSPHITEELPKTVNVYLNDIGASNVVLEDTTKTALIWTSNNSSIASVENNQITALTAGRTSIFGTVHGTDIYGEDINVTVIGPETANVFRLFLDDWQQDIDTDSLYIQSSSFPHEFAITEIPGGRTNNLGHKLQLDFSQIQEGGINGIKVIFESSKDLSQYNALTFWAKSDEADSILEKIIVSNGKSNIKNYLIEHQGNNDHDTPSFNVFGTQWRKVQIPIFGSFLNDTIAVVRMIHEYDSVGAPGPKLDIDELQYERLDDLNGFVDRIDYSTSTINASSNTLSTLPNTVAIYLNYLSTGNILLKDTTETSLAWKSENSNIATFEDNQVIAVSPGTTNIYGNLIGTDINGPQITVNVQSPPGYGLRLYLFSSVLGVRKINTITGSEQLIWNFNSLDDSVEITELDEVNEGLASTSKYMRLTGIDGSGNAVAAWHGHEVDFEMFSGFELALKAPAANTLSPGKVAASSANVIFESNGAEIDTFLFTLGSDWSLESHEFNQGDFSQITTIKISFPSNQELLLDEMALFTNIIDNPGDAPRKEYQYLYSDRSGVTVTNFEENLEHVWELHEGYNNSINGRIEQGGGTDSGGSFLRLEGNGGTSAVGGWGDKPLMDFTDYDKLLFSAKAPSARNISFAIIDVNDVGMFITKTINRNWQELFIPLSDFTNVDLTQIKKINYALENSSDLVYLDEIYLSKDE